MHFSQLLTFVKSIKDKLNEDGDDGENGDSEESPPQELSEGTTVILLRSKQENCWTTPVLHEILGMAAKVVADGITDGRIIGRLGLKTDHSGNSRLAVTLVEFLEPKEELEEGFPELEN